MRKGLTLLLFVVVLIFLSPGDTYACLSDSECNSPPTNPPGCQSVSARCGSNGQCEYTNECSCGGRVEPGPWIPSPCSPGEYQTRDCETGYQIRLCGTGGGNPPSCWNGAVNCPAGQIRTNTPVNTFCEYINSERMCMPLGTAQLWGAPVGDDCCRYVTIDGEQVCVNQKITTYSCRPVCTVTRPIPSPPAFAYNAALGKYSATLNWTPGTGGTIQRYRVATTAAETEGCPGGVGPGLGCVAAGSAATGVNNRTIAAVLEPSTTYHWRVIEFNTASDWKDFGGGCTIPSTVTFSVPAVPASCEISLPDPFLPLGVGGADRTFTAARVSQVSGNIDQVLFSLPNTSLASFVVGGVPGFLSYTDTTRLDGFTATLRGSSAGGPVTLTARGTMVDEGGVVCTGDTTQVSVTAVAGPVDPWWQVIGGDIISGNNQSTNITSAIPSSTVLIKDNFVGGFSGVPSAGGFGSGIDINGSDTSIARWQVPSGGGFLGLEGYNYTYFERKIPSEITPTNVVLPSVLPSIFESGGVEYPAGSGYFWYRYNGASDITISGGDGSIDLLGRKVILFVGTNVTLGTKVTTTDGLGAFYLFSKGDITIAPTVGDAAASLSTPDIEGILFAEDQIIIPTNGLSNDLQLHIRGSVVGLGINGTNDGIDPNRVLSDNNLYPSEVFEFGPDLILNWPSHLTRRTLQWREVAP